MLQTIRDRASGWIAYIIVGLLTIPFALWGINSYFGDPAPLDAAQAGDDNISLQEFQQAYQQQRQRLQNLLGDNFDPALLDDNQIKNDVIQRLVDQRILLQAARQQGMRISDAQLQNTLQSYTAFQQDGVFNPTLYQRVLRSQGFSPVSFEEDLRRSMMLDQLQQGLVTSSLLPQATLDSAIALMNQQREIHYITLPLANYQENVSVEETAIEAYYQENKDRFLNPEQVQIQYLELKLDQLAKEVTINEETAKAAYEQQLERYGQPEERSASHILAPLTADASPEQIEQARAQAQTISDAIKTGAKTFQQAMEEAANNANLEADELGVIGQGMLGSAFEDSLFELKAVNDVSEPVQTSFGFHIIRLDGITPAQLKPFEEVREELIAELQLREAENHFYEVANDLEERSYEQPDTLEPVAAALGLELAESDWFGRQGGEGVAAHSKVVNAAFDEDVLQNGRNSDPLEVEPSHVIVIRVKDHKEAAPRTLEETREDIVKILQEQQAREDLTAAIESLRKRAEDGAELQTLAEEFNGELKSPGLIERNATTVDRGILTAAFQLPPPTQDKPSIDSATLVTGDQAVISVTQIVPGEQTDPEQRKALARQLTNQSGTAQFQNLVNSLRDQTPVTIYSDRL